MTVSRVTLAALVLTAIAAITASQAGAASSTPAAGAGAAQETTPTAAPWDWLKMPKVTMPKISMPKMPADPFAPVKTSAKKVGDGTKKAWEGTKEIFTFGGDNATAPAATAPAAPKDDRPFWKRVFGGEEKKEPEGPQTVAEWMAQPRLDP